MYYLVGSKQRMRYYTTTSNRIYSLAKNINVRKLSCYHVFYHEINALAAELLHVNSACLRYTTLYAVC